jgi:hypothetical protein
MREQLPELLELARRVNHFGQNSSHGGLFRLQGPCGSELLVISWDGMQSGWEQVAVSTDRRRCPNWLEMCFVKDLFWHEEECVVQYHPPLSQYVKNSRYCLHLWKPRHVVMPAPPANLIGILGLGPNEAQEFMNEVVAEVINNLKLSEQNC